MTAPAWWKGPISWILRSPVHWILSKRLLLIGVRGRRTGRVYSLPVGYVEAEGAIYVMVGDYETKRWWLNLRGGAPVTLLLQGRSVDADAEILDPDRDHKEFDRAVAAYRARFRAILDAVGSVLMVRCALA